MRVRNFVSVLAVLSFAGLTSLAADGKAVVVLPSDIPWADAGAPGVKNASVEGDLSKGASHFFLKYPKGLVTPSHFHTADHYVLLVSGNLVLVADGKENKLSPGSYFALTGKAKHVARCEGAEDCVMFVDSRGKWDVVADAK